MKALQKKTKKLFKSILYKMLKKKLENSTWQIKRKWRSYIKVAGCTCVIMNINLVENKYIIKGTNQNVYNVEKVIIKIKSL